jgi:hypothetical protein
LYDSRFKEFKGKPRTRCLGACEIDHILNNGSNRMVTIHEDKTPLLVNGHLLKLYKRPLKKGNSPPFYREKYKI